SSLMLLCRVLLLLFSFVLSLFAFFFSNDTATTAIYTLSLHDALPICFLDKFPINPGHILVVPKRHAVELTEVDPESLQSVILARSEEHTSELQSRENLVCRLLLEKKKKKNI